LILRFSTLYPSPSKCPLKGLLLVVVTYHPIDIKLNLFKSMSLINLKYLPANVFPRYTCSAKYTNWPGCEISIGFVPAFPFPPELSSGTTSPSQTELGNKWVHLAGVVIVL